MYQSVSSYNPCESVIQIDYGEGLRNSHPAIIAFYTYLQGSIYNTMQTTDEILDQFIAQSNNTNTLLPPLLVLSPTTISTIFAEFVL